MISIEQQNKLLGELDAITPDGTVYQSQWRDDGVKFTIMKPQLDEDSADDHVAFAHDEDGNIVLGEFDGDQAKLNQFSKEKTTKDFKVEVIVKSGATADEERKDE